MAQRLPPGTRPPELTGNSNAGNSNSNNYNAGNYNAGNYNSGNYNAGNYNSGNYNAGNYNAGNSSVSQPSRLLAWWQRRSLVTKIIIVVVGLWIVWNILSNLSQPKNSTRTNTTSRNATNAQSTAIAIPTNVAAIGERQYANRGLTSVTFSAPSTVATIRNGAFRDNQLVSIAIPSSVRTIGQDSFRGNRLASITIPNSVRDIGMNAFANNPITSITIGSNVTLGFDSPTGIIGILGSGTGFNGAYANNNSRAGTYTRRNANSTDWSFNGQAIRQQTTQQQSTATGTVPLVYNQYAQSTFTTGTQSRAFSFSVTNGTRYNVWLDDWDADRSFIDAFVSTRYADGTAIFSTVDVAQPAQFTANRNSTVIVTIVPRINGQTGAFKVGYNSIR